MQRNACAWGEWTCSFPVDPALGFGPGGRFSLGLAGGLVVLCAHMGGTTLAGSHAPRELLAWTLVVVYWAAVANLLGFWVSGAAVLVSSRDLGHLARVFWVERGVLAWSQADEQGTLQGPRLRTGEAYALTVAGAGAVGQFLQDVRRDGQEPLVVRLSAGSSTTIACLSPGGEVIAPWRLQVGRLPRLLRALGLAGLDDTVKPSGAEGLYVVSEVGPESWVLASAPGWAPVLLPFAAPEGLFEVVLPEPKLLKVRLRRQKNWEPVVGRVRLVALPQEVLLAELATNPQGVVELPVGPGEVRVVGEAEGFHAQRWEGRLTKPRGQLVLDLEEEVTLRGKWWMTKGSRYLGPR
ncbi:MAG: hypothetical protein N2447_07965 [Thermoanaerobaculum sp.]|nr:hypothetical protein [Thermoanaerobaculum sp.]